MAQVPTRQTDRTRGPAVRLGAREPDRTPVFLSHPKTVSLEQEAFLENLCQRLYARNLHPRTLGVTDYDIREPLAGVYGVMAQCYGLFTVAFARTQVSRAKVLRQWTAKDNEPTTDILKDVTFTSAWTHIETGMAYAMGLPIIIMRESAVHGEGVLEPGVAGIYLGEFELTSHATAYLDEAKSERYIDAWAHQVRDVVQSRTAPPRFYR